MLYLSGGTTFHRVFYFFCNPMSAGPLSTSSLWLARHLALHCLPGCRTPQCLEPTARPNPLHVHTPHVPSRPTKTTSLLTGLGGTGADQVAFLPARCSLAPFPIVFKACVGLSLTWCFWSHLLPCALDKAFLQKSSIFEFILNLIVFVLLNFRYPKIGISLFLSCEIKT